MSKRKVAIVLGILATAGVVVLYFVSAPSQEPFWEYVAEQRAAGEPTSVEESLGRYPFGTEGAAAVLAAREAEARSIDSWGPWPWDGGASAIYVWLDSAAPDEVTAMRARLGELKALYDRLDVAARGAPFTCEVSWSDDNDPLVPGLQAAYRLLWAKAVASASQEERLSVAETLERLSRLARGTTVRRMCGVAMKDASTHVVRREVENGLSDPTTLRTRLCTHPATEAVGEFPEFVSNARVEWLETFTRLLDGRSVPRDEFQHVAPVSDEWHKRRVLGLIWNRGTPIGAPSDCVSACKFLAEIASIDTASFMRWRREIQDRVTALPKFSMASYVAIVPRAFAEAIGFTDAASRLARVALAAAEHRQTHGDYPATLDDLKWAFPDGVPLDPFTDAPFVYERTATGARIASLGRLTEEPPVDEATLRERVLVWELKR